MATTQLLPGTLLPWFEHHGRHDLPWQHPRTPYRVWLSEVMLQQTQVATVIPYFLRFLERFPDLAALAAAPADALMAHWAGLGDYARARNLQAAARACVQHHDGQLPRDPKHRAYLQEQMIKYLFNEGSVDAVAGYQAPQQTQD